MKTRIPLLRLAALAVGLCAATSAQAALISNGIFTVGVGSTASWTVVPNVNVDWNGVEDYVLIRSGGSLSQVFGDSYVAALGDQIAVNWVQQPVWNSPTLEVVLFYGDNTANVLTSQIFPLSGSSFGSAAAFAPNSISYTALPADVGQTVGIRFVSQGVFGDDRWVGIDTVSASVVTAIPEPSTAATLVGLGILGFSSLRRRA
jgi:hypothetical protein